MLALPVTLRLTAGRLIGDRTPCRTLSISRFGQRVLDACFEILPRKGEVEVFADGVLGVPMNDDPRPQSRHAVFHRLGDERQSLPVVADLVKDHVHNILSTSGLANRTAIAAAYRGHDTSSDATA